VTPSCAAALCRDLNTIADWLAFDDPAPNGFNVIVLLGNQVIRALTHACQLAQTHQRATLLFSGGFGHATRFLYENLATSRYSSQIRDRQLTPYMGEAELYAVIAQRVFSIPSSRIRVEAQSTNGGENARFSLHLLQQEGLAGAPTLLLQDPLMQRRSVLTWAAEAERAGIYSAVLSRAAFVPRVDPSPDNLPQLIAAHAAGTWTFPRYLGMLFGEIARLRDDENGYGPRGKNFLPHVDIPVGVWDSYQRLLVSPLASLAAR